MTKTQNPPLVLDQYRQCWYLIFGALYCKTFEFYMNLHLSKYVLDSSVCLGFCSVKINTSAGARRNLLFSGVALILSLTDIHDCFGKHKRMYHLVTYLLTVCCQKTSCYPEKSIWQMVGCHTQQDVKQTHTNSHFETNYSTALKSFFDWHEQ